MEIGYCLDCNELNYAISDRNGVYEGINMSNNHYGHRQYIFKAPNNYSPPIRNVLTKLQAHTKISDNELIIFKLALDFGELDSEFAKIKK